MLPVKADLVIFSPVIGVSGLSKSVAFMSSHKMDFSSCMIMPSFGKSMCIHDFSIRLYLWIQSLT